MDNLRQHIRYLTIAEILEAAEKHVGNYQFLHKDQLDYLVEVVCAKFGDGELYPTLPQKAAVYAHQIIAGHIFLDGNKRIGMNCALLFLEFNGCTLRLDIDDSIIELGFKIADGSMSDIEAIADTIESWVL